MRPNVQDLRAVYKNKISPYYEKPYFPQEVDKLTEETNLIKKDLLKYMAKAEIVGQVEKGGEERPIMYSTVINPKPTTITHPVPKPDRMVLRNGGADALFDGDETNTFGSEYGFENVIKGGSIPVRIQKNMSKQSENFENPVFIHKSEKVSNKRPEELKVALKKQVEGDLMIMKDRLRYARSKREKVKALDDGIIRLNKEIREISHHLEHSVDDILEAKETGNILNNVLDHYEHSLHLHEASHLKLVDVVEIKNDLKRKLYKEIQGIRTSDHDYPSLRKVNKEDIRRVIQTIKDKLGF